MCSIMLFCGCNSPFQSDENTNENSSKFSLFTSLENCNIEGDKINITVPNNMDSISFTDAFSIPNNYKWELHYDRSCLPELNIVSKSINLEYGNNTVYAIFFNKNNTDEFYLYEISVYRLGSAVGTYTRLHYILNIYEDGTLYLSCNGQSMDLNGTWTQSGDSIRYSVWDNSDLEWNNPFFGTVYDDGIEFLGEYYQRSN